MTTDDSPATVFPMVLRAASLLTRRARLTSVAEGTPPPTASLEIFKGRLYGYEK